MTTNDRNCLSYWLPRLIEAGVPVPRTEIVTVDDGQGGSSLSSILDGEGCPAFPGLVDAIQAAAEKVGYPAFLRTGQGSGKHRWSDCCHLPNADAVPSHVAALVEWSHLVDFMGLPHGVWCVREMLPVEPVAYLSRYRGMPLVKEVRAFVADGKVRCAHPYWPVGSILEGLRCEHSPPTGLLDPDECPACQAEARRLFDAASPLNPADEFCWRPLAEQAAAAFAGDGAWGVDLLATRRGWFVTDCAEAERSFHYPNCEAKT